MKCDELRAPIKIEIPGIGTIESAELYLKSEVDAAIDELKAAHHKERHEYIKMIAELKQKLENHRKWIANHPGYYTKEAKLKRKEKRENGKGI